MSVKDQEFKLNEAKHFYEEMEKYEKESELEKFKYSLSAFTTAGRSILQYAHKEAKNARKLKKYNNLLKRKTSIKYFKSIRNLNVHEEPTVTIAHAFSDVLMSITVPGKDGEVDNDIEIHDTINSNSMSGFSYHFEDGKEVLVICNDYLIELEHFIQSYKSLGI